MPMLTLFAVIACLSTVAPAGLWHESGAPWTTNLMTQSDGGARCAGNAAIEPTAPLLSSPGSLLQPGRRDPA
jgi:hypothetical protein